MIINPFCLTPSWRRALLTAMTLFSLAANARAVTLTFGELPFQPVDNLSFSGVTFDFKIGGVDSLDANYNSGGPGTVTFIQDPSLEGNSSGVLRMDFATPTPILSFGVAESTPVTLAPGFVVDLFGASLAPIGTYPITTLPLIIFTEGSFSYAGVPVSRALVTFTPSAGRFALDNLHFVPEPSSLAFAAFGGLGFLGYYRRANVRPGR
jgi:PEP-CTERM motif